MKTRARSDDLARAVGDLFAGGFVWVSTAGDPGGPGTRVYDGQVLGQPETFVVVEQRPPDVEWRALSRARHAHWCLVRCTVTARAVQQWRDLVQDVVDTLEGLRPIAPGWLTSPLEEINANGPFEDHDVAAPTGRWPVYGHVEFAYTATFTGASSSSLPTLASITPDSARVAGPPPALDVVTPDAAQITAI